MRRILTAPLAERPGLLTRMLAPVADLYRYMPGDRDLVRLHHAGDGFRVDREDERLLPALDALTRADAWGRLEAAAIRALDRLGAQHAEHVGGDAGTAQSVLCVRSAAGR